MGAPVVGAIWLTNDDLNPFDLTSGRAPQADNEVVIDKGSADKGDFVVGDSDDGADPGRSAADRRSSASPRSATPTARAVRRSRCSPRRRRRRYLTHPGKIDAIRVVADPRCQRDATRRAHLARSCRTAHEVLTGAEITKEDQAAIKEDMSFFNVFLMVFAVIALFVGSFIIYNSFSILVAQRTKEMALMRAIGASRTPGARVRCCSRRASSV